MQQTQTVNRPVRRQRPLSTLKIIKNRLIDDFVYYYNTTETAHTVGRYPKKISPFVQSKSDEEIKLFFDEYRTLEKRSAPEGWLDGDVIDAAAAIYELGWKNYSSVVPTGATIYIFAESDRQKPNNWKIYTLRGELHGKIFFSIVV